MSLRSNKIKRDKKKTHAEHVIERIGEYHEEKPCKIHAKKKRIMMTF